MIKNLDEEKDINYVKEVAKVLYGSNLILQEEIKHLKSELIDHNQLRLELNGKLVTLKKRFFDKGCEKLHPKLHGRDNEARLLVTNLIKTKLRSTTCRLFKFSLRI